jgi:hypothetical protein
LSDDVSAIPKYIGGQASGGAGRTSSGLSMLMQSAAKILQTVADNVDRDLMEPALLQLVDLVMLTDTTGLLTGEESVSVEGVAVAVQRETERMRQLEFLQHTANPLDQNLIGLRGRGAVLRSVAKTIGLDGDTIVPSDDELEKQQAAQQQGAEQQALDKRVEQGVQMGVQLGTQKIASELTAGLLAAHGAGQPQLGAPPLPPGGAPAGPPGAGSPGGPMDQAARQAQGNQPSPTNNSPAGNLGNIVGNQPKPPGPGGRAPMPQGGPG